LDELPQLWNAFVGEMWLVGPRPLFDEDSREYLDHHHARLGVKSGITGLWQVNGRRAVTDFDEVVRLDREYIDRWSLWPDLRILGYALRSAFRRTGAFLTDKVPAGVCRPGGSEAARHAIAIGISTAVDERVSLV
jgi:lipopolysaccharide/colanic/teichoic acid biosynthesis glycosyltransferase